MNKYTVQVASEQHFALAESICHEMAESAKARGTGIAKRTPEYLQEKMSEGKAIIATDDADGLGLRWIPDLRTLWLHQPDERCKRHQGRAT